MIETQCEEDKECRERVCVSEQRISWSRQLGKVTYKRHFLSDRRSPNAWDTLSRKGYAESCNPFQKPKERLMLIGPLLFNHACIPVNFGHL